MKYNGKISVIIPIFNAGAYIGTCIASLLKQTYEAFELILVDDGSTDATPSVLAAYQRQDPRIRVLRQENSGVSAARNRGLDCATGAYIAFVDADDFVAADYLERLYRLAQQHRADMVCCDFVQLLEGQPVQRDLPKVLSSRLVANRTELLRSAAETREAYGTCVWGKLIRAELAKSCRFRPLKIGEDQVYMHELFLRGPRVWLDAYRGYFYVVNPASVMQRSSHLSLSRCLDELTMHRFKLEHLLEETRVLDALFRGRYAMAIHTCAHASLYLTDKTERKKIRALLLGEIQNAFSPRNPMKGRAAWYLRLYRDFPGMYTLLLKGKDYVKPDF